MIRGQAKCTRVRKERGRNDPWLSCQQPYISTSSCLFVFFANQAKTFAECRILYFCLHLSSTGVYNIYTKWGMHLPAVKCYISMCASGVCLYRNIESKRCTLSWRFPVVYIFLCIRYSVYDGGYGKGKFWLYVAFCKEFASYEASRRSVRLDERSWFYNPVYPRQDIEIGFRGNVQARCPLRPWFSVWHNYWNSTCILRSIICDTKNDTPSQYTRFCACLVFIKVTVNRNYLCSRLSVR